MLGGQHNPLVAAAVSGKRLTQSYLAPAVIWMIFMTVTLLSGIVFSQLPTAEPESALAAAAQQTIGLVLTFGAVALLLWLWIRFYEGRGWRSFGFIGARSAAKIGRGALVATLLVGGSFAAALALGVYATDGGDSANFGVNAMPAVLLALPGWIVQASTEEAAFRGYLLPVMAARGRLWLAVIASAAVFAAMHLFNPNVTFLGIFNIGLYGVFTALYALREAACGAYVRYTASGTGWSATSSARRSAAAARASGCCT
ncbi:MAG: type II CAAX endopeptidase family protein [Anaerolineae bacterium]